MPWTDRAACRGEDTELFFPIGNESTNALTVCRRCPVSDECLTYALTRRERGIWGGTTEPQRQTLLRRGRHDARHAQGIAGISAPRPDPAEVNA